MDYFVFSTEKNLKRPLTTNSLHRWKFLQPTNAVSRRGANGSQGTEDGRSHPALGHAAFPGTQRAGVSPSAGSLPVAGQRCTPPSPRPAQTPAEPRGAPPRHRPGPDPPFHGRPLSPAGAQLPTGGRAAGSLLPSAGGGRSLPSPRLASPGYSLRPRCQPSPAPRSLTTAA